MIPIFVKSRGVGEPAAPLHYLVAGNGVHLVRKTKLFTSVTPAVVVAGLEAQPKSLTPRFPKLPRALIEKIYGFFIDVFHKWEGEALVLLYYRPEPSTFLIGVPPQIIRRYRSWGRWRTFGHVEYGSLRRPEGFLKLGDAHSHGTLPAYFSGVDDQDDKEDGLRIVLGHMHRPKPDVCVSFVAAGNRFPMRTEDMLEDFDSPQPAPERWLRQVTCREEPSVAVNFEENVWNSRDSEDSPRSVSKAGTSRSSGSEA